MKVEIEINDAVMADCRKFIREHTEAFGLVHKRTSSWGWARKASIKTGHDISSECFTAAVQLEGGFLCEPGPNSNHCFFNMVRK